MTMRFVYSFSFAMANLSIVLIFVTMSTYFIPVLTFITAAYHIKTFIFAMGPHMAPVAAHQPPSTCDEHHVRLGIHRRHSCRSSPPLLPLRDLTPIINNLADLKLRPIRPLICPHRRCHPRLRHGLEVGSSHRLEPPAASQWEATASRPSSQD
uniref:Uncharacterized protein n=1 Tax=Eutreptiella gymnastica TaxID=73025 RepID=A0A7S1I8H9_9EUGL|mmetsp:Transcript_13875/g.24849  ORF Transcript_13875/g.24849 Transcript_13875/m.24849 type:complete len:153 (+) Transcript_13875:123-581(+)